MYLAWLQIDAFRIQNVAHVVTVSLSQTINLACKYGTQAVDRVHLAHLGYTMQLQQCYCDVADRTAVMSDDAADDARW